MAERCVRDSAIDMSGHREGWVHQYDGRADRGVEMIVDVGRVVPGDGHVGKQVPEQFRASLRQFVQHKARAGMHGEYGE